MILLICVFFVFSNVQSQIVPNRTIETTDFSDLPIEMARADAITCSHDAFVLAESGIIQTTNYPSNYPPDICIIWHISVPVGKRVWFRFDTFQLATGDFVFIYDGATLQSTRIGSYAIGSSPVDRQSTGNEMIVFFHADSTNEAQGVSANFKAMSCGGDLTGTTGTIESPNYPKKYPPMSVCLWKITTPVGTKVKITFTDFKLEGSVDYVEIFNGDTESSPRLAEFSGISTVTDVRASGNTVLVKFVSSNVDAKTGFSATFSLADTGLVGGTPTSNTEFPNVVAVEYNSGPVYTGVALTSKWVMLNPYQMIPTTGELDKFMLKVIYAGLRYEVTRIVNFPALVVPKTTDGYLVFLFIEVCPELRMTIFPILPTAAMTSDRTGTLVQWTDEVTLEKITKTSKDSSTCSSLSLFPADPPYFCTNNDINNYICYKGSNRAYGVPFFEVNNKLSGYLINYDCGKELFYDMFNLQFEISDFLIN